LARREQDSVHRPEVMPDDRERDLPAERRRELGEGAVQPSTFELDVRGVGVGVAWRNEPGQPAGRQHGTDAELGQGRGLAEELGAVVVVLAEPMEEEDARPGGALAGLDDERLDRVRAGDVEGDIAHVCSADPFGRH
jgi:hypothetical protein